jgi:hypothetical protein
MSPLGLQSNFSRIRTPIKSLTSHNYSAASSNNYFLFHWWVTSGTFYSWPKYSNCLLTHPNTIQVKVGLTSEFLWKKILKKISNWFSKTKNHYPNSNNFCSLDPKIVEWQMCTMPRQRVSHGVKKEDCCLTVWEGRGMVAFQQIK